MQPSETKLYRPIGTNSANSLWLGGLLLFFHKIITGTGMVDHQFICRVFSHDSVVLLILQLTKS